MLRPLAVLLAFGCVSACSLIVDTSGLSGGAVATQDAGASDGPELDSSVSDGRANVADGPDSADGSMPGVPDAAASPCGAAHLFCDDFDTGSATALAGRWTSATQNAGPLAFDSIVFESAPRALSMTVQPGTGYRSTELRKSITVGTAVVQIDVDIHAGTPSTQTWTEVDPMLVTLYPTPAGFTSHSISVSIYTDRARFEYVEDRATAPVVVAPMIAFPLGKWVHVTMTVDYSGSPATATIAIDGTVGAKIPLDGSTFSSLDLALGAPFTQDATVDWTIDFDNVVVN